MKLSELSPGDIVRVREWGDMAEEFGLELGAIRCRFRFVDRMRYLCGAVFIVDNIDGDYIFISEYDPMTDTMGYSIRDFSISADMLEPYDNQSEFDEEDFMSLLSGF